MVEILAQQNQTRAQFSLQCTLQFFPKSPNSEVFSSYD